LIYPLTIAKQPGFLYKAKSFSCMLSLQIFHRAEEFCETKDRADP